MKKLHVTTRKNGRNLFDNVSNAIKSTTLSIKFDEHDMTIKSKDRGIDKSTRYIIADAIANYIIDNYEKQYIESILKTEYKDFDKTELGEIFGYTLDILNNPMNFPNLIYGYLSQLRKTDILSEIYDYFKSAGTINVEGFIRFRLDKYKSGINRIIDEAINEYLNDNEIYNIFDISDDTQQASKKEFDTVHVMLKNRGYHKILDNKNEGIKATDIKQYIPETKGRVNYNELLISELLNIEPKRIILHNIEKFQDADLISNLREVFGSRLEIYNQERKQQL